MSLSVTRVVNALLCSDELYCPLHQSGVAVAGATNAVNTKQSEAVTVSLFFPPHHPYPQAFCTLPSFAHIKRPRWLPVGVNDRHLRSHGKIGDCEQSRVVHIMLKIFTIMLILYAHKMLPLCSKSPTIMLKFFPRSLIFLPKIKYNCLICLHGYG